ncbi:MAG: ABC transporter substrate-binding protein [Planctomycetota bacterium]|jgi:ABC-type transport system substrate-binding protein
MESGKVGTLALIGIIAVLVVVSVQLAQKDSIERRLDDTKKELEDVKNTMAGKLEENKAEIGGLSKETQGISKDLNTLKIFQEWLSSTEKRMAEIEANARRIERLEGKVETLAKTRVVPVPYPAGGQAPFVPPGTDTGDGGEEEPRFTEGDEGTKGVKKGNGKETIPGEVKRPPAGKFDLEGFNAWKKKLVGRKLTKEEMDKLWAPDPKGVIRPVVPADTTWYDASRRRGVIRRRLGTDPKGFNPLTENSADVAELESYCIPYLCQRRWTDPDVWEYDLATSVEISDDFKVYTFTLRKGLKWQFPAVDLSEPQYAWLKTVDREVTAEDFKFRVDMVQNPQVQCEHGRVYYKEIEKVEVLDRYTFRIVWSKKTFNSLGTSMGMPPLPKFLYAVDEIGEPFPAETLGKEFNEHWYNNMMLGAGPYKFVEWREGQYVKLARNEEYFGPEPYIKEIIFYIIRDNEAMFLKLQSNNPKDRLDFAGITRTQYKKHYKEPLVDGKTPMFCRRGETPKEGQDLVIDFYTRLGYYYVGWNLEKPIFKDKRVRQALTHCFPRQLVLDTIFEGLGDIVSGNFYLHGPDYNHDIKPYAYDLEQARRLLAEAGWADLNGDGVLEKEIEGKLTDFKFSLYIYANSETYRDMANIYKEHLRKIGVLLNPTPLDWSLMQQKMENREFDSYTGGWALGWTSDPKQIWHSEMADTPKSSNFVSFRNKECDQIIDTARETFDPIARQKLFHRFHEIVHEEQPYTFLFCVKSIPVWWPHVNPEFYPNRPQAIGVRWFLSK